MLSGYFDSFYRDQQLSHVPNTILLARDKKKNPVDNKMNLTGSNLRMQ